MACTGLPLPQRIVFLPYERKDCYCFYIQSPPLFLSKILTQQPQILDLIGGGWSSSSFPPLFLFLFTSSPFSFFLFCFCIFFFKSIKSGIIFKIFLWSSPLTCHTGGLSSCLSSYPSKMVLTEATRSQHTREKQLELVGLLRLFQR